MAKKLVLLLRIEIFVYLLKLIFWFFIFPTLKIFSHDSQAWFCLAIHSQFGYTCIWIDKVEFCCSCIISRGWCVLNINQVFSWYHPLRWGAFLVAWGSLTVFCIIFLWNHACACQCKKNFKPGLTRYTWSISHICHTWLEIQ